MSKSSNDVKPGHIVHMLCVCGARNWEHIGFITYKCRACGRKAHFN